MKRHFSGKEIMRMICLLFSVGILLYICCPIPVYAAERESYLTVDRQFVLLPVSLFRLGQILGMSIAEK